MSASLVLKPCGARLIVRPAQVFQTRTASKIETVKIDEERPPTGVVLAIGPDVKAIAEGDVVMYGKFTGTEAALTPTFTLLVLEEHDILTKIQTSEGEPPALELSPAE